MEEEAKEYGPKPPGRFFFMGWVLLVIVVFAMTAGLVMARGRLLTRQTTELEQQIQVGPRVLVVPVAHSTASRSIEIPGTIHGFAETPVYAKIAGYLKAIYVDKGDRVKSGQRIALLDSPELDHQVKNARASFQLAS